MRALRIHPEDTVATLLEPVAAGDDVEVIADDGGVVLSTTARQEIAAGHKISLAAAGPGDLVVKYGEITGEVVRPVAEGDHVHVHNVKSRRIR
jgi:hypothetical protein